ncbi:NrfD/PsrC family molybdoenzyme membrane anchor subunit [Jatrophihabitans sp. YIM 134969]
MSGPNGAGPNGGGPSGEAEVTGYAQQTPGRSDQRRRRKRGGAETLMVPEADFRSYYGRQILKSPTWERLDIAGYLFAGGLAAGSSLMAALGDATGRESLVRIGRLGAVGGMSVSFVGLIHDLGRPERFTNMLRVFKPTSPMSVGTYIISAFSAFAFPAAAADVAGGLPAVSRVLGSRASLLPPLTRAAGFAAAGVAPGVATYTAVLIADTAVPAWHEPHRELPFVFAGSAIMAGGSLGALFGATDDVDAAHRMVMAGGLVELAAEQVMQRRMGIVAEAFEEGEAGRLMTAAKAATAGAVVSAALGRWVPLLGRLSGLLGLAGSALTRFGIFQAGVQSAEDPRFVVVPQRERLEREGRASADAR